MTQQNEACTVTNNVTGETQTVTSKQITVYTIGSGKKLVDVADLAELQALGGEGKRVTVDGQDASQVSGPPTGTERVTVAPQKGGNG